MFKSKIEKVIDETIKELEHKITIGVDEIDKHPDNKDYVKALYMHLDQWTILNEVKRKAKVRIK